MSAAATGTRLLLASSSPYRRELLRRLQLEFSWQSPAVDESPLPGEAPENLVNRLAEIKARAVAGQRPDPQVRCLVIGSDQVAVQESRVLGKPGTAAGARDQLRSLSGTTVRFLTSLCLLDTATDAAYLRVNETHVRFRVLSDQEIARYVTLENPIDCAGSFKSEGLGVSLFERVSTEDPTALIGLPMIALCEALRLAGHDPLATPE